MKIPTMNPSVNRGTTVYCSMCFFGIYENPRDANPHAGDDHDRVFWRWGDSNPRPNGPPSSLYKLSRCSGCSDAHRCIDKRQRTVSDFDVPKCRRHPSR